MGACPSRNAPPQQCSGGGSRPTKRGGKAPDESTSLLDAGEAWAMERVPMEQDFVDYKPLDPKCVNEELETNIEPPKNWLLVLINLVMSFFYMIHVFGAWLFVGYNQREIFPQCLEQYPIDKSTLEFTMTITCSCSVGIFWSFPILLSLVALLLFSRDVLLMYVYYEMMRHRVHIAFEIPSFFGATAVWFLLAWGGLGCSVYYFTGHLGIKALMFTLPYWIPIVSFLSLLFSSWILQTRLVSVSNFVRSDLRFAKKEFDSTCLIRDFSAQLAWSEVRDDLANGSSDATYETGELIHFMVDKCRAMTNAEGRIPYADMAEMVGGTRIMNPHYFGSLAWHGFDDRYWAKQLITHDSLECPRTSNFKKWYCLFRIYRAIMILLVLFCMVSTVVSVYVNQGWKVPGFLKPYFEYLTVKSLSEQ